MHPRATAAAAARKVCSSNELQSSSMLILQDLARGHDPMSTLDSTDLAYCSLVFVYLTTTTRPVVKSQLQPEATKVQPAYSAAPASDVAVASTAACSCCKRCRSRYVLVLHDCSSSSCRRCCCCKCCYFANKIPLSKGFSLPIMRIVEGHPLCSKTF